MNTILIGNIIAFIAASISVIIGIIKNKKKIIILQALQSLIYVASNFILGSFSGVIIQITNIIRNLLCYREKLTKKFIILLSLISIILTLKFNNLGIIGLLPLFANIIYTAFMNIKDEFNFKVLFLVTLIPWLIHDTIIKSYTSSIFHLITIISCIFSLCQMSRKKYKSNTK